MPTLSALPVSPSSAAEPDAFPSLNVDVHALGYRAPDPDSPTSLHASVRDAACEYRDRRIMISFCEPRVKRFLVSYR